MSDRPPMPAITPAIGGSIGAAAAFIAYATTEHDRTVRIVCIVSACISACVASVCERSIRKYRNETEQHRIQVSGEPAVILADESDYAEREE